MLNSDLVITMFSLKEVSGDNYNDMKIMLNSVTTRAELKSLWDSFNEKRYFKNLTDCERELIILHKESIKEKLIF